VSEFKPSFNSFEEPLGEPEGEFKSTPKPESEILEDVKKIEGGPEGVYEEAPKVEFEEELDKQEVLSVMNKVRERLRDSYDIDNLTTIEGVELRHIVEKVLREFKVSEKLLSDLEQEVADAQARGDGKSYAELLKKWKASELFNFDNPAEEAHARWLSETFGVNPWDVLKGRVISDLTTGETVVYPETKPQYLPDYSSNSSSGSSQELEERKWKQAHNKLRIWRKMGHKVFNSGIDVPTPEFKEWLARQRYKQNNSGEELYSQPREDQKAEPAGEWTGVNNPKFSPAFEEWLAKEVKRAEEKHQQDDESKS
jgi:hypothetical protein